MNTCKESDCYDEVYRDGLCWRHYELDLWLELDELQRSEQWARRQERAKQSPHGTRYPWEED